ncbi:hypothetical protein [Promicromonospora sp. NPDC059942]|uniref:hypothetical protein n=1 Tax=Promicromonospora sp. NPDC059942 TaxID=3347009 RepID=UPI0036581E99
MNLTRAARSLLADPRREIMSVLAVMFLVLTVVGVQLLCGVHLDEAEHTHPESAVGQYAASAVVSAGAEGAAGHHGEDPNHCSENRTVTARYDRSVSPSAELAGEPVLALQWLVPDLAQPQRGTASGVAVAAAPSLHALGISRT